MWGKKEEMANSKTEVGRVQAELIIKLEHLIKLESKKELKKRKLFFKKKQHSLLFPTPPAPRPGDS